MPLSPFIVTVLSSGCERAVPCAKCSVPTKSLIGEMSPGEPVFVLSTLSHQCTAPGRSAGVNGRPALFRRMEPRPATYHAANAFPPSKPYQVVPPSSVMNVKISTAPIVAVREKSVPPGKRKAAPQVIVLAAAPCVIFRVIAAELPVAGGLVMATEVMLPAPVVPVWSPPRNNRMTPRPWPAHR